MGTRGLVFVFATMVLIISLSGCAPAGPDPNDPIVGVYSAQVSGDEIVAGGGSNVVVGIEEDAWQLEFTKDGMFRRVRIRSIGPRLGEEAPYHLSGNTLIVEKGSGENGCFPTPGEDRYRLQVNGGVLTLTTIEDYRYRKYVVASKPWVREP